MRHRVSMWVVIALVGALAATTTAVVVLATNDDGWAASRPPVPALGQGPWQMPVMGDDRHGWDERRGSDLLPWLLFAIATGMSVGLLIAWSPWRRTPAPVAVGDGAPVPPGPDATPGEHQAGAAKD